MSVSDYEIECPFPGCYDSVFLQWFATFGFSPEDFALGTVPPSTGAHSTSWQVECSAGHVILLPGDPGCGCDDPESAECRALGHLPDEFDWSDDDRKFRPHDLARLSHNLVLIGGTR